MKKITLTFLILSAVLSSCSQTINKEEKTEIFVNNNKDKDKIQIKLSSNEADDINLCIYELNWKRPFTNIAFSEKETKNKKLLQCSKFDNSVNNVTPVLLKKNQEIFFEIKRYKLLKQIAVVANYPKYSPKSSIRLFNVPRAITKGWNWIKKDAPSPYIVTMSVNFDKNAIAKVKKR